MAWVSSRPVMAFSMRMVSPSLKAYSMAAFICEGSLTLVTPKLLPPSEGFTNTGSPSFFTMASTSQLSPRRRKMSSAILTPVSARSRLQEYLLKAMVHTKEEQVVTGTSIISK